MIIPYCNSLKCAGNKGKAFGVAKENIPLTTTYCPDCTNALIWKKRKSKFRPGRNSYKKRGWNFEKAQDAYVEHDLGVL